MNEATAEWFVERGIDPAEAPAVAAAHNAQVALPSGGGPMAVPTGAPAPGVGAPAAQAEIDAILADRASGKISNYDWQRLHEPRLRELMPLAATIPASEMYQSPRSPSEYKFPRPPGRDFTSEELTSNAAFADAAIASSVPKEIVNNLAADAAKYALELQRMSPDDAQVYRDRRKAEVRAGLQSAWGEAAVKPNMDTVGAFLDRFCAQHPKAAEAVTDILGGLSALNWQQLHTWIVATGGAR